MHKNDKAVFQKFMIISWVFKIVQNHQESFKINNFFPVKAEGSYFSNFIMCAPVRARARANFTLNAGNSLKIGWTCHFWKTPQKNLNLQISIFSKIASFYPNLIIFFSSESWGFILFKFYHARTRARQNHIFWKFSDFGIFSKFPAFKVKLARACARAGAHMIKFENYELSVFI